MARVALAQITSVDDIERNCEVISEVAQRAAAGGADLVVFPEHAAYRSKTDPPDTPPQRQTLDESFVQHVRATAKQHNIAIVAGMGERVSDENRLLNTAVAVGQNGELIGAYRKIHLMDALGSKESDSIIPGNGDTLVFPLKDVVVGVAICYDLRFPELARRLVDDGANVLLYPSAWLAGNLKEMHWETLLRARAIENVSYVVGVSQCELRHTGHSIAFDPMGVTITSLGDRPALAFADVDAKYLSACRERNPSLQNRRL